MVGLFSGAGSGNRTRLSTLEGSHNNHYTIPAWVSACILADGNRDDNMRGFCLALDKICFVHYDAATFETDGFFVGV